MAKYITIIGRNEPVDIVGTALEVPAKIDTGAFRSAIHACDIKVVTKDGKKVLLFTIFGHKNAPIKRELETTDFDEIEVMSSNGKKEKRYEVQLKIKLANKTFLTSFSLADRTKNVFPILIGRKALTGRYMVNTAVSSIKLESLLRAFGMSTKEYNEEL